MMDYVIQAPRLPNAGETILGESFATYAGGKGANQALAAAKMGSDVIFISAVGDDDAGRSLVANLQSYGVDCSRVSIESKRTGTAFICLDKQGRNQIVVAPGANMQIAESSAVLNRGFDVALAQLEVPIEAVVAFFESAVDSEWRILNPAPAAPLPKDIAQFVNVLVPNEQEALFLTGSEVPSVAGPLLLDMGFEHVILTLGASGCCYYGSLGENCFPAPKVNAVDTVGAGDVFCGSLASFLARDRELFEAIELAVKAASISVTRYGAQASVPTLTEVVSV